jgi:hypothetical protein
MVEVAQAAVHAAGAAQHCGQLGEQAGSGDLRHLEAAGRQPEDLGGVRQRRLARELAAITPRVHQQNPDALPGQHCRRQAG